MKAALTALLLAGFTAAGLAQSVKCRVCDQPVEGPFYQLADKTRGGQADVCADCAKLESRCFACGLPVKAGFTTLTDGRLLCARDAREAVLDNEEARRTCLEVRDDLDRLYSRFLSFPCTNVVVTILDRFTLESLFKAPGYSRLCTSVFGTTRSHELGDGVYVHTISVLSALSRPRLAAVAAHEFAHAWLTEHLPPARRATMAPEAVEAFCELIAYQLMEQQREHFQMQTIKANLYTRGQFDAFLAAETRHGFNALIVWMQSGESAKLDPADPDAVRATRAATLKAPRPGTTAASPSQHLAPAPLPEILVLKGISGPATRRFAIINDRTFGVNDTRLVRLAKTNLLIRCLEIRTNSVLIRIEGIGERRVLTLPEN